MATVYNEGVWREEVTATNPSGGGGVSPIVMVPEGVTDISLFVVASAAGTGNVTESPSSGTAIQTGTPTPTWIAVDASLTGVGTTMVKYDLVAHTPVALKIASGTTDETATLIAVGKFTA